MASAITAHTVLGVFTSTNGPAFSQSMNVGSGISEAPGTSFLSTKGGTILKNLPRCAPAKPSMSEATKEDSWPRQSLRLGLPEFEGSPRG